jgi:hypothetical protein
VRAVGGLRLIAYLVAGVIVFEEAVLIPRLGTLLSLPFGLRAGIVFLLLAPLGAGLGTFFPTALAQLREAAPAFVPWAWGINGIFSVLAPVLAVGVSVTSGISTLLLAAVPVYLIVGWSLPGPRPRANTSW